ncbi:MAG: hypothetical protein QOD07_3157 [Frankiaceae bacterium]|nr:hypothetical protein [Frankiaceae bacterium]
MQRIRHNGPVTFEPGGPLARRQAEAARRPSRRPWLFGTIFVIGLLLVAGNGSRSWWAQRVGDLTSRNRGADFAIGLLVGLLPVIAVAVAALSRHRRRALRMFVAGAVAFIVTDLLAPSLWKAITNDTAATRPFEKHAPGYLPGVYVGGAIWFVLLVVAFLRARRAWRARFARYR